MSRLQFSKVNSQRGAPMGRASYGSIPECFPRSVRLFRVNIDSQGYDDGGAYWGIGQPLWCAIGEHDTGCQSRAFVRAKSRESAIVALNIECGLLIQGPQKANLDTIKKLAMEGYLTSSSLHDRLIDLGYYD